MHRRRRQQEQREVDSYLHGRNYYNEWQFVYVAPVQQPGGAPGAPGARGRAASSRSARWRSGIRNAADHARRTRTRRSGAPARGRGGLSQPLHASKRRAQRDSGYSRQPCRGKRGGSLDLRSGAAAAHPIGQQDEVANRGADRSQRRPREPDVTECGSGEPVPHEEVGQHRVPAECP